MYTADVNIVRSQNDKLGVLSGWQIYLQLTAYFLSVANVV